jgi:predicted ATP-dependent endonuclease of OLD family
MELASVVKMAVGRRMNYLGISREPNVRITFSQETIVMGKKDLQRYIKITKIEIIFADTLQHLVMTTFRVRFPYIK